MATDFLIRLFNNDLKKTLDEDPNYSFPATNFAAWISFLFLICMIVYLPYSAICIIKLNNDIHSWPTAIGKIDSSDVSIRVITESRDNRQYTKTTYYPRIVYTYTVNKVKYRSRQFSLEKRFRNIEYKTRSDAAKRLKAFPLDGSVRVHYKPSNHSFAIIDLTPSVWIVHLILLLIITGIWIFCFYCVAVQGLLGYFWQATINENLPCKRINRFIGFKDSDMHIIWE